MALCPIRGLSLCSGVGGFDLGLGLALGPRYRTVGYVERDAFCASVLVARMEDEALDRAPIWDAVESFCGADWRGRVEVLSAGFPCQPASAAGSRKGQSDARWIWPDIADCIRDVGPQLVFLENVRGLLSVANGTGFGQIIGDLASFGFDAEWGVFSAAEVGAPHRRERVFILAKRVPDPGCDAVWIEPERGPGAPQSADEGDAGPRTVGEDVGDPGSERLQGLGAAGTAAWAAGRAGISPFPPGPADGQWASIIGAHPELAPATQPEFRGLDDGMASRVDRLRAAGNGVVPQQAAKAFLELWERFDD